MSDAIPFLVFKSDDATGQLGMNTLQEEGTLMTAESFSLLAAVIFALLRYCS